MSFESLSGKFQTAQAMSHIHGGGVQLATPLNLDVSNAPAPDAPTADVGFTLSA